MVYEKNRNLQEKILQHNEEERIALSPIWITLFSCYLVWQMGIIFFSSDSLSLYGKTPIPIAANNTTWVIIFGYLISAFVLYVFPKNMVLILRSLMLLSIVASSMMYLPFPKIMIAILFYTQTFVCVFMICGYILLVITLLKLETELNRIGIGIFLLGICSAILHFESLNIPYIFFNGVAILCQMAVLAFLFYLPIQPKIHFVKKEDAFKMPCVLVFGFIFTGFFTGQLACFSNTIAESIPYGISVTHIFAALGALFFLFLRKKMDPGKIFTIFVSFSALGFVTALASVNFPGLQYFAAALLGLAMIAYEFYTYFGIVVFSRYPSRLLAPLLAIFALAAAIVPILLQKLFRTQLVILYTIYGIASITLIIVYFITAPYFSYALKLQRKNNSSNKIQKEKESADFSPLDTLSLREKRLAQLILQGYTESSISKIMNISLNTQKGYRKNLYLKLQIHSKRELFELMGHNE